MPLKVWNGSAWTMAGQMKVWNGSSWVQLKAGKVWNGSSWVQFHPGAQLVAYGGNPGEVSLYHSIGLAVSSDYAEVGISLKVNGAASYFYADSYDPFPTDFFLSGYNWLLSGATTDYYAFMDTPSSGSFTSGTTNSAIQLNSGPTWTLRQTSGGSNSVYSTLRIRTASGVDITTISVILQAEVIP